MVLQVASGAAQEALERFPRPAPNVERQIDRLDRAGSVEPLTRRRLRDQLRREPVGADRSRAERTLERLPTTTPPPPDRAMAPPPEPDPLPSTLRPGFSGGGGGPGISGYTVPPGGRASTHR